MESESIRLYPTKGSIAPLVELTQPLPLDSACTRCPLSSGARVCMPAEGTPGGVLIVGMHPGLAEERAGRANWGTTGQYLRRVVDKLWSGPVVYDHAVKCRPKSKVSPTIVSACRPYLSQIVQDANPSRIIALGATAISGVVGRSVPPMSTRRGYTWMRDRNVPVYFLPHPAAIYSNRILRAQFEADLDWCINGDVPRKPPLDSVSKCVTTAESAAEAVADLRACEWVAFDVETSGVLHNNGFRLLSLAACGKGQEDSWVWDEAAMLDKHTAGPILDLLADPSVKIVGQNVKYDIAAVYYATGVQTTAVHGDTRLWRRLLESDSRANLGIMAELVGMGGHKGEADEIVTKAVRALRKADDKAGIPRRHNYKSFAYEALPLDILLRYNGRDAVSTARIAEKFELEIAAIPPVQFIWDDLVKHSTEAVEQIERWGMLIDTSALNKLVAYLDQEKLRIETELAKYGELNPASTPQLSKFLFSPKSEGGLALPIISKTPKGSPSTGKEVLTKLAPKHPAVQLILDWRVISKIKGTYADGLTRYVRDDARVHPNINIDGAASGRMSCSEPNLQNIPRSDFKEGKMVKDLFIAPPGHVLLQADYSQLELRIAAVLSGDPEMRAIFDSGEDYHQKTALMIAKQTWGIDPDEVEKKHRSQAKTVNFGLLYGMNSAGLAHQLGITVDDADAIKRAVLGKFKVLNSWINERLNETRKSGYAWTWWRGKKARRRPLLGVGDTDDGRRLTAERSSWNTPIQGTASDFCLASLIKCVSWIKQRNADPDLSNVRLVMTVHDSLIFEVAESDLDEVASQVVETMTSWDSNGVPLKVDLEVGKAWGSMEHFELGE